MTNRIGFIKYSAEVTDPISLYNSDQKSYDKPLEQETALAAHCSTTGHKPNFDKVTILQQEKQYLPRLTLEMLHTMYMYRKHPQNTCITINKTLTTGHIHICKQTIHLTVSVFGFVNS